MVRRHNVLHCRGSVFTNHGSSRRKELPGPGERIDVALAVLLVLLGCALLV
jgi:hypothetical protein